MNKYKASNKIWARNINKYESEQMIISKLQSFGPIILGSLQLKKGPKQTQHLIVEFENFQSKSKILGAGNAGINGAEIFDEPICYQCYDRNKSKHLFHMCPSQNQSFKVPSKIDQSIPFVFENSQSSISSTQCSSQISQKVPSVVNANPTQIQQEYLFIELEDGTIKKIVLSKYGIKAKNIKKIKIVYQKLQQKEISFEKKFTQEKKEQEQCEIKSIPQKKIKKVSKNQQANAEKQQKVSKKQKQVQQKMAILMKNKLKKQKYEKYIAELQKELSQIDIKKE